MNKMKIISLSTIILCGLSFLITQGNIHALSYDIQTVSGEESHLENIAVKIEIDTIQISSNRIEVQVHNGKIQHALLEAKDEDEELSLKSALMLNFPEVKRDETRLEISEEQSMSSYSMDGKEPIEYICKDYSYEQDVANIVFQLEQDSEMQDSYYSLRPIETQLKMYSTKDAPIQYNESKCVNSFGEVLDRGAGEVNAFYAESDTQILGQDKIFYTMPRILPNMEGNAEVVQINLTAPMQYEPEIPVDSVHTIPIKLGMVGFLNQYGQSFYTFLWREGTLNVKQYDRDFKESASLDIPFALGDLDRIQAFESNEMIVLVGKNILYAVDRNTMELVDQLEIHDSEVLEDVMYKDHIFYVASSYMTEEISSYVAGAPNAMIRAYTKNTLLYEGVLNLFSNLEAEKKFDRTANYIRRSLVQFVRDAL